MWTHISVNCDVVWESVLWRAVAIWDDGDGSNQVTTLERCGQAQISADDSVKGILEKVVQQMAAGNL